jgi:hypothetical protein
VPAGGRNRVAFPCVGFLSNPQCVQLGLESAAIDHRRYCKFISHGVLHRCASIGQQFRSIIAPFMPLDGPIEPARIGYAVAASG